VQDYLVKGNITSTHLERAMRYAIERQALLHTLEMSRKQQLEFKNQFLSHVSHELRTPLTCIHQYVTILLDGLAGEMSVEQRDHLGTILKSVNQLGAMVRDLLEGSRAESGKMRIERRCVAIADLVRSAVAMMQATAKDKRVGLEIGVDDTLPFVYGDADRILEVLINLIDNAIKFTPPEGAVTGSSLPGADGSGLCLRVGGGHRMRHQARGARVDFRTFVSGPERSGQQPQGSGFGFVHRQGTGVLAWRANVGGE
jgi:signal transduction histidine kinase